MPTILAYIRKIVRYVELIRHYKMAWLLFEKFKMQLIYLVLFVHHSEGSINNLQQFQSWSILDSNSTNVLTSTVKSISKVACAIECMNSVTPCVAFQYSVRKQRCDMMACFRKDTLRGGGKSIYVNKEVGNYTAFLGHGKSVFQIN